VPLVRDQTAAPTGGLKALENKEGTPALVKNSLLNFCTYSVLLVLYWLTVRAKSSLNALPSPMRSR